MMNVFIIILLVGIFVLVGMHTSAFGHGIGGETLPPVTVGDRNATIYLNIDPPVYDPQKDEQRILVRFFDADTDAVIEHVTYIIELKKGDTRIFKKIFHDDFGNLILKIKSTNDNEIKVYGKESVFDGWMSDGVNPVTLEGPIFTSGGLYEFNIEILTLDNDSKVLDERVFYKGAISVADKTQYNVKGKDGNDYLLGITSWYDQVSNFEYSVEEKKISFEMPFDWSEENIKQVQVVHEEIHIPKNFGDLLVTKYDITVNGIPLPANSIVADDYSEEDRIVHSILPKSELLSIREAASKISAISMQFVMTPNKEVILPLVSRTTSYVYDISLWWEPLIIKSEEPTKFFVDITELYVIDKEQRPVQYDLVLKQQGNEIFRKRISAEMNAPPKSYFEEFTFSRDQVGPVLVAVENIDDTFLGSTDFMIVVEPKEIPRPEFPIRLTSVNPIGDESLDGNYYVDITWFPSPLKTYEEVEFILTIYDKSTGKPVKDAKYDFAILDEKNSIIAQKSGIAKSGGSFENFRFGENDLGNVVIRIDDINDSNEYVELPTAITPEFPLGSFVVLLISVASIIFFQKNKPSLLGCR